jgi:dynein heavy chain
LFQGSSVEEAQLLLDDHTIKSQAMQSSPAAAAFLERIETWVKKLSGMQDIFDAWLQAQVRQSRERPLHDK